MSGKYHEQSKILCFTSVGIIIFIAKLCLLKEADSPQAFMRALHFICIGAGSVYSDMASVMLSQTDSIKIILI